MKLLCIIPARYASTRFPGKPLVNIGGKSMIQRTYERANEVKAFSKVIVATDDARIYEHVLSFGGNVTLTSDKHRSGTERAAEVISKLSETYDAVINLQGDEPFINPKQIQQLIDCIDEHTQIATLIHPMSSIEEVLNPNNVKVVINAHSEAIYFSRSPIPYIRGVEQAQWLEATTFYKHIGIYAYKANVLKQLVKYEMSALEQCESLEQLRWIENGYKIKVNISEYETIGIDTPEDLHKLEHLK